MQLKGKERKGKGLLYLIGIAVLISIVFIACKNKPTGMNDFVPEAPEVNPGTELTPEAGTSTSTTETTAWKDCQNILQLFNAGYTYFVSTERQANGTFKYTLEIKGEDKIEFNGKDGNGNDISRTYTIGANGNKKYRDITGSGAELIFGSVNSLEDKYIKFKPAGMQNHIEFALAKKS